MKQKLISLDLYKALGAFLVIFIHVTATPAVTLQPGVSLFAMIGINRLALPAVPAFIFASGMALTYSYREKEFHYGSFLSRRFTKILIPYLIWCLVYGVYHYRIGDMPLTASGYFWTVVQGRFMYHLYFVAIILQFYLLFGLILAAVRNIPGKLLLPAVFLINLAAVKLLPHLFPQNADRIFLTYLIYFVLGCCFGQHTQKAIALTKRLAIPLTAGFLLFGLLYCRRFYVEQLLGDYSKTGWDSLIYLLLCTLGILVYYLIALGLERISVKWIRWVMLAFAAGSYYIYLSHPLAIIYSDLWADRLMRYGVLDRMGLELAVIFLTVVPLSIAYAKGKSAWKEKRKRGKFGSEGGKRTAERK